MKALFAKMWQSLLENISQIHVNPQSHELLTLTEGNIPSPCNMTPRDLTASAGLSNQPVPVETVDHSSPTIPLELLLLPSTWDVGSALQGSSFHALTHFPVFIGEIYIYIYTMVYRHNSEHLMCSISTEPSTGASLQNPFTGSE